MLLTTHKTTRQDTWMPVNRWTFVNGTWSLFLVILIQYSQRHTMINHCDRRITLLSDTDICFALFNLFTYYYILNNTYIMNTINVIWTWIRRSLGILPVVDSKLCYRKLSTWPEKKCLILTSVLLFRTNCPYECRNNCQMFAIRHVWYNAFVNLQCFIKCCSEIMKSLPVWPTVPFETHQYWQVSQYVLLSFHTLLYSIRSLILSTAIKIDKSNKGSIPKHM
jgi:hypothetical protein